MPERIDLPDVNVWLALARADHPHHERACSYWESESSAQLGFCRVTALGFARLLTQPAVMGKEVLSVDRAWEVYQAFRALPSIVLLREPSGCEARLGAWATEGQPSRRLWTDAYLASFAIAGDFRIVTFDRDFERFEDLDLLRLRAS